MCCAIQTSDAEEMEQRTDLGKVILAESWSLVKIWIIPISPDVICAGPLILVRMLSILTVLPGT